MPIGVILLAEVGFALEAAGALTSGAMEATGALLTLVEMETEVVEMDEDEVSAGVEVIVDEALEAVVTVEELAASGSSPAIQNCPV